MAKKNKNKAQNPNTMGNTMNPNTASFGGGGVDTAGFTPEQITQMQLEEAIKESQNPSMKLKKLQSPLSLKGCVINIVLFIVLTIVCVFLFIYLFKVQNFDLWYIASDMLEDFKITQFFKNIGTAIKNFFTGNKSAEEIIKFFI